MSRIDLVKESHPSLNDEDIRLLLMAGYSTHQDMDEWTETIKNNTLERLVNTISFIKSEQDGN